MNKKLNKSTKNEHRSAVYEPRCFISMFEKTGGRLTDGQTDIPSYRDARTHLKSVDKFQPLGRSKLFCRVPPLLLLVFFHFGPR